MMFNSGLAESEMRRGDAGALIPQLTFHVDKLFSSQLKISDFVWDSTLMNPGLDCRDGLGVILLLTEITRQWHDLKALIFS